MAKKFRIDLRKEFRAIGAEIQDANLARLIGGLAVNGSTIDPRKNPQDKPAKRLSKRISIAGQRIARSLLNGTVGVLTGAMLKDLVRRGNIKVSRLSLKIRPAEATILRWSVFNKGDQHQASRPVSGIERDSITDARDRLLEAARNQFAEHLRLEVS